MPFPYTISVLDDFTRADNANLGTNWTVVTAFVNPLTVESNKARGSAGNFCAEYWNVNTFGPDCGCYDTFILLGSQYQYLILRSDGNTNQYELVVVGNAPSTWQIYMRNSGGATAIGSSNTQAINNGDKWGFEAVGNVLKGYYFNGSTWSQVVTATDSTYTAAGRVGFGMESNGTIIDDFSGGTIVAGPAATATLGTFDPEMVPVGIF